MTDIEKAEKEAEKQPLLPAKERELTKKASEFFHQKTKKKKKEYDDETYGGKALVCARCYRDQNAEFGGNMELAIRGAIFALPIAFPFLVPWNQLGLPNITHATEDHQAYYSNTAVVIYVFTLYKTVGETICFATAGMLGTFMAVLNIWCMFGLIPHGVGPDVSVWVHVIGWTWGLLFTMIVLWLNLDILAKMFALSWHMYFWMCFLDPASERFNHNFGMRLDGPAFKALTMSALGCGVALLAACIPYPLLAINKARGSAEELAEVVRDAWESAVESYAGESRSLLTEDRLKHDLTQLTNDVQSLGGHVDNAWWECFGFGRVQKARVSLMSLQHALRESYNRLGTLLYSCKQESYGENHRKMMDTLRKYLQDVSFAAAEVFELGAVLAGQGYLSEDDIKDLNEKKDAAHQAVEALTKKFKGMGMTNVGEHNRDEASFCLSMCSYGTLAINFAEDLVANKDKTIRDPNLKLMLKAFDCSVLLSKEHLQWVFRNALSILVSFIVGFHGYSAMIKHYNSSPAETVSLLLSTFVGSAVTKNMGRVQGVVLGCVFGQLFYALFAWCSAFGYIAIGTAVFVWLLNTLFTYYNSQEFGYIGCLMAAFGTKYMLQGCSDAVFEPTGTYYTIVNTVVGISFMTLFDFTLTPQRTSKMASKKLAEAWQMYAQAVEDMFDPSVNHVRFHQGLVLDKITEASALGEEAKKEPRFHRTPWRSNLFQKVIQSGYIIRVHLCVMECSAAKHGQDGEVKSWTFKRLMGLKAFQQVKHDILAKIAQITSLLTVFTYEKDGDPFEKINLSALSATREAEQQHLKDLLAEVNEHLASEVMHSARNERIESLEDVMACKFSTIISVLDAQLDEISNLKHHILSS